MTEYADLSKTLQDALELRLPPIAMSFADAPPAAVPAWKGNAPAGCLFWQEAAQHAFYTSAADHELCSIGIHTHHLSNPPAAYPAELGEALRVMADLDYVRAEDVAAIPVLAREARHVVYAPLARAPLAPDLVLLFAHSRQGLVLTEAVQQVDGGAPPALGRPACAVVAQAVNSGRAALSLGCCGARAYLDALSDDVALWALPGRGLAAYTERIAALSRANRVLGRFHYLRRLDVEAGKHPSMRDSLGRLEADGKQS